MKSKAIFVLLLTVLIAGTCTAQKRYYKGNTHTHSAPQSGDANPSWTPDTVITVYKSHGYDFLVFTDHGHYWNSTNLSTPDFTVIQGEEAGLSGGEHGHFTAMNVHHTIVGRGLSHQQLLDSIALDGGTGFLNHPRWNVIPINAQQVINGMTKNLRHVEVFNGVTDKPTNYDTSLWDSVLTTGRIMYGVACDDAHRIGHFGKGWICVYASSNHPDTLISAIRNGEFYASNGIVLDSVGYSPKTVFVRSKNGTSIRFIGSQGKILATVAAPEAAYKIQGNEGYVRAEISNESNQTAWIQPYMIPGARK